MTCKYNWFLFNTGWLLRKCFLGCTCTDESFFLLFSVLSKMGIYIRFTSSALLPFFCQGIHCHCLLGMPALVYKSHLYKMGGNNPNPHSIKIPNISIPNILCFNTKNVKHSLFKNKEFVFWSKVLDLLRSCKLLVSVAFDFHSSPPVFFWKLYLLGSASLNRKRIGKDKVIPVIKAQQQQRFFVTSGQFRPWWAARKWLLYSRNVEPQGCL